MDRPDPAGLAERARGEVEALERELAEIEMLIGQATTEAARHEAKRAQLSEKLAALAANRSTEPAELGALAAQVVTLTKRAALMGAQVDVLAGKQKTLARYRDALAGYAEALAALAASASGPEAGDGRAGGAAARTGAAAGTGPTAGATAGAATSGAAEGGAGAASQPAVSRLVLGAQEDLRREIARAMHDGPAQSLTNIVLQAQILERLLAQDPERARSELHHLTGMVQSTLEATKSFIFDVRPMVLDDLGLVPTIRRAARDRGRRAGVPVEFDSVGADRRLPSELESALFRMLDEALAAYLDERPLRVVVRLDWSDRLEASVAALRAEPPAGAEAVPGPGTAAATASVPPRAAGRGRGRGRSAEPAGELPPALAAMIEERRAEAEAATVAARSPVGLPAATWREIEERAATLGIAAELLGGGSELRLRVPLPPAG